MVAPHLRVAPASVSEWKVDLEGQGSDMSQKDGGMELRGRERDEFAIVSKVNNVYPIGLKVMTAGQRRGWKTACAQNWVRACGTP